MLAEASAPAPPASVSVFESVWAQLEGAPLSDGAGLLAIAGHLLHLQPRKHKNKNL